MSVKQDPLPPASTQQQLATLVLRYLAEILGGECSITREDLEQQAEDPMMLELLTGLLYLHEDLVFRETERARAEGELKGVVARLEEMNRELDQRRADSEALARELSTPIINVWAGVLMVPLIGRFDDSRSHDMMERLLAAVVRERASYVILDFTGMAELDAATADHFLRVISSIKLLGAKGIVTGVPPAAALAMVELGIDIASVVRTRTLAEAIVYCTRR
jgi:anti-anti-sigma regulatory factor